MLNEVYRGVSAGVEGLGLITKQATSLAELFLKFYAGSLPEDIGGFRSRLRVAVELREARKAQRSRSLSL
jgi:hypothetical protein